MKKPVASAIPSKHTVCKRSLSFEIHRLLAAGSVSLIAASLPGLATADPQGGQVAAGQATISHGANITTIDQSSSRAVLNWESFNVGVDESVRFNQPGADSATLNRVMGHDASSILGRISATGQVFLVNPNGIVFGRTAQVDVGSLVASSANITDADFMAGRMRFAEPGKANAVVENAGLITVADGGFAALVGPGVRNSGIIQARLGAVTLASGEAFTLDLYGDRLINLIVDSSTLNTLTDAQGTPLVNFVDHSGVIAAEGGRVNLTVNTAKRLLDSIVNVSGVIRATGFESHAGTISLLGDEHTKVSVSGLLDASGPTGGHIEATGRDVLLASTAVLTASGSAGDGGNVFVGGNWQGQGELANAQQVVVERGALIDASAKASGNAGTVVVWSDGDTAFAGTIEATGAGGGLGGQVEVSGKRQLGFDGDVSAASLLLDPTNVIFDAVSGSQFLPGSGAGDYTVKVDAVNRQLVNGTSVTVQASNDITVNANAVLGASSSARAGGGLAFDAGNNIVLNGSVVLNNANFSATAGGSFTQGTNSVVATGNGTIEIDAARGIQASNLMTNGAIDLSSSAGAVQISQALSGLNGSRAASLAVSGRDGVTLAGGAFVARSTSLQSTSGSIDTTGATIDSTGTIVMTGASGIQTGAIVSPATVTLSSSNGGVTVNGAVAGAAGQVSASTAATQGLTIHANGAVSVNAGAALGSGGLTIDGATSTQRAAAATFNAASVFSAGALNVRTTGDINFGGNAGARAAGITLDSSAGSITTGVVASLTSSGPVTLNAGNRITVGGNATTLGGIQVTNASDLSLTANGDVSATGSLKTTGAAIHVTSTNGNVSLNGISTWALGASDSGWLDVTAGLDVVLNRALGGDTTGYELSAARYRADDRPEVGRVTINAGRDVELNGLNLDGNTNPDPVATAGTPGLFVEAGNRILSNQLIAVNKGDLVLRTRNDGPINGIYLGNSVYSRGYDAASGKTGYNIFVGGSGGVGQRGNIFLFDNTDEYAAIADRSAPQVGQEDRIAKIVIANNVANYSDAPSLLVAATNAPTVTLRADSVVQTSLNPISVTPQDPADPTGTGRPLSLAQLPTSTPPGGGFIGLKVQVFQSGSDAGTQVQPITAGELFDDFGSNPPACIALNGCTYAGAGLLGTDAVLLTTIDGTQDPVTSTTSTIDLDFLVGSNSVANTLLAYRLERDQTTGAAGSASLFVNEIGNLAPQSITTNISRTLTGPNTYSGSGPVGYDLTGRLVQTVSGASAVTRELIYTGVIQSNTANAVFDTSGNLLSGSAPIGSTNMGGVSSSNAGFTAIGGFGTQAGGTLAGASANGIGLPRVAVPTPEGNSPLADLIGLDRADDTVLGADDVVELVLGHRPSSEADFGRSSASAGHTPNVFRKRYLIAETSDASVCAPDDVEIAQSAGQSAGGGTQACVKQ